MKNTTDMVLAAIGCFQAVRATLRVFPYKVPYPQLKMLSMGLKNEDVGGAVLELLEGGQFHGGIIKHMEGNLREQKETYRGAQ